MRLTAALAAFAAGAILAELLRWPPAVVNALALAGGALVIAFGARGRARDLALPRGKWWEIGPPLLAASLVSIPTLFLPYFADDHPLLAERGQQPSFWAALAPVPNDSFFRPVGWAFWWFCGKFLGDAPAAAHAIAALLFAWNAVLLVPALRRSGVPRGVSVASGVLFAAHPAALETVAWLSNAYSLFALGFSLAALACLPVRRRGFLGILPSLVFAALAFLSKEDTYLLPVACVLVGSRFRLRNLGSGARRAAPIFAAAAACLALRSLGLGGIGGYRDPVTGQSLAVQRMTLGLYEAFQSEAPTSYFLPLRHWWTGNAALAARYVLPLTFPILLAAGGASPIARAGLLRAAWLGPLGWVLAASIIPVNRSLENARAIYGLAAAVSLAVASLLAGLRFGAKWKWGIVAAYLAACAVVSNTNFTAWRVAAERMRTGVELAASRIPKPGDANIAGILVLGLPDSVLGAVCFRNAVPLAVARGARAENVSIMAPPDELGVFQEVLCVDVRAGKVVSLPEENARRPMAAGESWQLDFAKNGAGRAAVRAIDFVANDIEGAWSLFPLYHGARLLLPTIEAPAGGRIAVAWEGECVRHDGSPGIPTIVVTKRVQGRVRREVFELPAEIPNNGEGALLSIELRVPLGATLRLRSMTLTAR
jgi:hypothetical protein